MRSTGLGISLTIRRIREKVPPVVEVKTISTEQFDILYVSFASVELFQLFRKYCSGSLLGFAR
jgi:hypothetical protein